MRRSLADSIETALIPIDWEIEKATTIFPDRIYGLVPITPFAEQLLRTPEIQRLKWVSHLGLLNGMTPLNICASRYEHSLGVYTLVLMATRLAELRDYRDLLVAAAICHDKGTPPFSHTGEAAQHMVLGVGHEHVLKTHFNDSKTARVIERAHLNYDEVVTICLGTHPNPLLNELVNGTLDLDTLDGTCRYALTWNFVTKGLPYSPKHIVYYYQVEDGKLMIQDLEDELCIPEVELMKFINCRREVFQCIFSSVIQAPQVHLERALYLAARANELPGSFFRLTDEQAAEHLRTSCNPHTEQLVEMAVIGDHYPLVWSHQLHNLGDHQRTLFSNPLARQEIADTIAAELSIPAHHLGLHLGLHKGSKNLSGLIARREDGSPIPLPNHCPLWLANAYLHPDHRRKTKRLENLMKQVLRIE